MRNPCILKMKKLHLTHHFIKLIWMETLRNEKRYWQTWKRLAQRKNSIITKLFNVDEMDLADLNRQEDEIAQSIADLRDLLNSKDVSLFFAKKSRNAKFKKKMPPAHSYITKAHPSYNKQRTALSSVWFSVSIICRNKRRRLHNEFSKSTLRQTNHSLMYNEW